MGRGGVQVVLERYVSRTVFRQVEVEISARLSTARRFLFRKFSDIGLLDCLERHTVTRPGAGRLALRHIMK
jgi:hypothetical protein